MSKKTIAAFLLASAIIVAPAYAGSNSAEMTVSVEVLARTIVTIDSEPAAVNITAADVARGYIDLPQSVRFHVRSNASNGYVLQFQPVDSPFTHAEIAWGNTSATISADGAWLSHPYQRGATAESFSVRVNVAPGTAPGTYVWPIHFEANPM